MGGGKSKSETNQDKLASQQLQQSQDLFNWSKDRTARMDALQSPALAFAQSMASGDPTKIAQASAVPISQIDKAYSANKENIYDNIGSGAARDFALASADRSKVSDTASTMNQTFLQSLATLMGAGKDQGTFGLQQMGAGLRAGEGASSTDQSLMNADAQRKATQMGFLGSLAGTAGSVVASPYKVF